MTLEEALGLKNGPSGTPAPTEGLLAMALADIPHVGKFCGHAYPGGKGGTLYCKLDNQICCHQVHDICLDWNWRGFGGGT